MESNANVLLRKKYFVSADTVFLKKKPEPRRRYQSTSRVIDSASVKLSEKAVRLPLAGNVPSDDHGIDVKLIREGDKIKKIKIICPCGRSTELNCEYSS
jgi:hypothetical protein